MAGDDALRAAREELYARNPEDFTTRRGVLAGQARKNGDAEAARAITALRRPTKAAGILNQLARAQPDVAAGLAEIGAQLRQAQRSLDGARLRELTARRRQLIDSAARQAFAGQQVSAAAVQQEVTSTLEAALADPAVAEQFAAGVLVRGATWSGFGDSTPTLSAVPEPEPVRHSQRKKAPPRKRSAAAAASVKTAPTKPAAAQSGRPTRRIDERRQRRVKQDVEHGTEALEAAVAAEQDAAEKVDLLRQQLADARLRLDEARLQLRRVKARRHDA